MDALKKPVCARCDKPVEIEFRKEPQGTVIVAKCHGEEQVMGGAGQGFDPEQVRVAAQAFVPFDPPEIPQNPPGDELQFRKERWPLCEKCGKQVDDVRVAVNFPAQEAVFTIRCHGDRVDQAVPLPHQDDPTFDVALEEAGNKIHAASFFREVENGTDQSQPVA